MAETTYYGILGLYWSNIERIWGYMTGDVGIMENKMETTMLGQY